MAQHIGGIIDVGRSPIDEMGDDLDLTDVVEDLSYELPLRKSNKERRNKVLRYHYAGAIGGVTSKARQIGINAQVERSNSRRNVNITLAGTKPKDEGKE